MIPRPGYGVQLAGKPYGVGNFLSTHEYDEGVEFVKPLRLSARKHSTVWMVVDANGAGVFYVGMEEGATCDDATTEFILSIASAVI